MRRLNPRRRAIERLRVLLRLCLRLRLDAFAFAQSLLDRSPRDAPARRRLDLHHLRLVLGVEGGQREAPETTTETRPRAPSRGPGSSSTTRAATGAASYSRRRKKASPPPVRAAWLRARLQRSRRRERLGGRRGRGERRGDRRRGRFGGRRRGGPPPPEAPLLLYHPLSVVRRRRSNPRSSPRVASRALEVRPRRGLHGDDRPPILLRESGGERGGRGAPAAHPAPRRHRVRFLVEEPPRRRLNLQHRVARLRRERRERRRVVAVQRGQEAPRERRPERDPRLKSRSRRVPLSRVI